VIHPNNWTIWLSGKAYSLIIFSGYRDGKYIVKGGGGILASVSKVRGLPNNRLVGNGARQFFFSSRPAIHHELFLILLPT